MSESRNTGRAGVGTGAAAALAIAAVACSGSSTELGDASTCGAGTMLVDGMCVVSDGGSGDGGDAGSRPRIDGGDAGTNMDEPCPGKYVNVNCTDTCGGASEVCRWGCELSNDLQVVSIGSPQQLPFVIRTPSSVAKETPCTASCPNSFAFGSFGFGMLITTPGLSVSDLKTTRVRVAPPVLLALDEAVGPDRCVASQPSQCVSLANTGGNVYVYLPPGVTTMVSRNVYVESVPDGQTPCP